jgi:O-methyltransferase
VGLITGKKGISILRQHLYTFEGLPPPNEGEYPVDRGDQLHRFPQLAVRMEEVTDNFSRFGPWSEKVRFVKGWFKDTVPAAPLEKIAVLRLDGDLYESTIQVLGGFSAGPRSDGANRGY